jgi:hypothetical protein
MFKNTIKIYAKTRFNFGGASDLITQIEDKNEGIPFYVLKKIFLPVSCSISDLFMFFSGFVPKQK